jgi:hypothetical protein
MFILFIMSFEGRLTFAACILGLFALTKVISMFIKLHALTKLNYSKKRPNEFLMYLKINTFSGVLTSRSD